MEETTPENASFLRKTEIKVTLKLAEYVPKSIGTKALTILSLLSSVFVFISYILTGKNRIFFLLASLFILFQWIFDCLDGTIGRMRNEGFIRWGYYMDHLFDFFFLSAIVLGFYYVFDVIQQEILFLYFILSSFMVTFFLMHAVRRGSKFHISFMGISPSEGRLLVIMINLLLFFEWGLFSGIIIASAAWIDIAVLCLLIFKIYKNQKMLDKLDRRQRGK